MSARRKALLCVTAFAVALCAPAARAQTPAPNATISVGPDFTFQYSLDQTGWSCRLRESYEPVRFAGPLRTQPYSSAELARCATRSVLAGSACGPQRAVLGDTVTCTHNNATVAEPSTTVAIASNAEFTVHLDVAGRRAVLVAPRAVANELGAPTACSGARNSRTERGSSPANCVTRWEHASALTSSLIVEAPAPDASDGTGAGTEQYTVSFGQRRLVLSLRRCQLRFRSSTGALVLGADRQRIALEGDCAALDGFAPGTQLSLIAQGSDGQVTGIPATVEWGSAAGSAGAREMHIALSNIPLTLPAAPQWSVSLGNDPLGRLSVAVSQTVNASQLEAHYGYPELEVLGGGAVAPATAGGPGVAVVDPTDLGRLSLEITDTSGEFSLPPRICDRSTGAGCGAPGEPTGAGADPMVGVTNVATLNLPSGRGRGIDDGLIWCASSPDGQVEVVTADLVPLPRGRWTPVPNGLVRFRVRDDRAGPIELFVRAVRTDDAQWTCGADLSCWERQYRTLLTNSDQRDQELRDAIVAAATQVERDGLRRELDSRLADPTLEGIRAWLNRVPATLDLSARDRAFDLAAEAYRLCLEERRNPIECDPRSDRAFATASTRAAELELATRAGALWRAALGIAACSGVADVDLRVRVASSARRESIPLPVSNRLSLVCEYDPMQAPEDDALQRARDGEIIAPMSVDACRFEYHPELSRAGASRLHRLRLYGRQMLRVRVRAADQQEPIGEDIVFDPFGDGRTISGPLRFPVSGQQQDDFIVTAVIGVRRPDVPYRRDSVEVQTDGAEYERGAYRFIARVRPRGALGQLMMPMPFRGPRDNSWIELRFFITVPIGALAVRLPASPIDLETSRSEPNVHASTLRTGVLLVAEPWDFRMRRNPTLVGLQAKSACSSRARSTATSRRRRVSSTASASACRSYSSPAPLSSV